VSIRKIIRRLILESMINENETKLNPGSFDFKITGGPLLGYRFSQEKRETPADYAIQEMNEWNGRHDNNPDCIPLMEKYWGSYYRAGSPWPAHNSRNPNNHFCEDLGRNMNHPWSAAFVRWCMQESVREEFNSINHIPFFIDAYVNRHNFIRDPETLGDGSYMLFFTNEINEEDIIKGDNGMFFRDGTNQTPEAALGFFERNRNNRGVVQDTHSDICIGNGRCIGGNVGSPGTVGERDVADRFVAIAKFVNGYEYAPEIETVSDSNSDYPESKV